MVDLINKGQSRRAFAQLDLAEAAGEEFVDFSPGAAKAYDQLMLTAEGGALLVHYLMTTVQGISTMTAEDQMRLLGTMIDAFSKGAEPG